MLAWSKRAVFPHELITDEKITKKKKKGQKHIVKSY